MTENTKSGSADVQALHDKLVEANTGGYYWVEGGLAKAIEFVKKALGSRTSR